MSTGGADGGGASVGGIDATVTINTTRLPRDITLVRGMLDQLEARFTSFGAAAAASTSRIDAGMTQGGKGASRFANQLQAVGQTLDDLQYVGEMGPRPILNNLMQINPLLGTTVLIFDALRRSGLDLGDMAKSLAANFDIDLGAAMKVDTTEESFRNLTTTVNLLGTAWKNFVAYVKGTPAVYAEALGITKAREEAAIKAFEEAPDAAMKARGKAVTEAIAQYGHGRFLTEMVDPDASPLDARAAKMELLDLVKRAKGGDRSAIFELEERTEGRPLGDAIRENLPGVKEGRKAMEEDDRERTKQEAKRLGAMNQELEVMEEMAEFDESEMATKLSPRQMEQQANLEERAADLEWWRMLLEQPTKIGKAMGVEAYQASVAGQGGVSEEAKRLHDILEVEKEIAKNTAKLNDLKTPRRVPR